MLSTSSSTGSTSCSASPCFASHGASFGPSFAIAIFLPIAPPLLALEDAQGVVDNTSETYNTQQQNTHTPYAVVAWHSVIRVCE